MIRTKREYEATLQKLRQNDEVLAKQKMQLEKTGLSKQEFTLVMSPLLNFRNQLEEEIRIYEGIKNKDWNIILNLVDFHNIGRFLIALRIAFGLTQKELAKILEVTEAQVSKDERNEYHGVSLEKAIKIMEIFGVTPKRLEINRKLKKEDLLAANY